MYTCKCGTIFTQTKHNQIYCSIKCRNKYKHINRKNNPKNYCKECLQLTHNKNYCSKQCFLKRNSIKIPTRDFYCQRCNIIIHTGTSKPRQTLCKNCNSNFVDWSKVSKSDMKTRYKNINQYHARIRSIARQNYQKTECENCGYAKHVEICHIKPVAEFPDTAFISEINQPTNLIALCPNCHWEFDNGYLFYKVAGSGFEPLTSWS